MQGSAHSGRCLKPGPALRIPRPPRAVGYFWPPLIFQQMLSLPVKIEAFLYWIVRLRWVHGYPIETVITRFHFSLSVPITHKQLCQFSTDHLTPSLWRPCIHAILFSTACRTACKHAFCFLRVRLEAVSTRHSWLWQTLDDVYTRRCFSESERTRFGAPGQKALPSGNEWMEWNEWMDFCLIPLSTTGSVEDPGTNL